VALRELQAISGSFDEVGRKNLTRDIVSTRVGHDLADRYAPQIEEARPTVDNKIAFFENKQLREGVPVPVEGNEIHGAHLQIHVPELMLIIEELNEGAADPIEALPALQAFYQHISETTQFLAQDPAQEGAVGEANQALQYAEEMINNTSKKVQKIQREQQMAEAQAAEAPAEGQPEGQPEPNPSAQKLEEHQMKMQMARQKAELEMELTQAKFRQEQAMRDAENVMKMRDINQE